MSTRWEVEQAVLRSKLEPTARLIVLTLLVKADNETAIIPPEFSPSLSTLCAATGLAKSALVRQLDILELLGWVKRSRPPKKSRSDRTSYALTIGANPEMKPARNCGRSGPRRGSPPKSSGPSEGQLSSPSQGPLTPASSPSEGQPVVLPKDRRPGGSGPSEGHASSKELPPKNSLADADASASAYPTDALFAIKPTTAPAPRDPNQQRQAPGALPRHGDNGKPLTENQRAKNITNQYHQAEPMSKWPAINAIVKRALATNRFTDEEIRDALLRLAAANRSVTVDSLRIELSPQGRQARRPAGDPDIQDVIVNGVPLRLSARSRQAMANSERLRAMERQTTPTDPMSLITAALEARREQTQ